MTPTDINLSGLLICLLRIIFIRRRDLRSPADEPTWRSQRHIAPTVGLGKCFVISPLRTSRIICRSCFLVGKYQSESTSDLKSVKIKEFGTVFAWSHKSKAHSFIKSLTADVCHVGSQLDPSLARLFCGTYGEIHQRTS